MTSEPTPPNAWRRHVETWARQYQALPSGMRSGGILLLLWLLLPVANGFYLLAHIDEVRQWIGGDSLYSAAVFACCYALLTGVGLLPTYAPTIVGGWIFGAKLGFAACSAGYFGGTVVGFAISRLVCGNDVVMWIDAHKRWSIIRRTILEESFWKSTGIITLIRLSPSGPFSAINLIMTACGAGWAKFLIGSSLGIAPRTFIACSFAASGAATGATDIQTLAKDQGMFAVIAGIVTLMISLAVIGVIARKALDRALRDDPSASR
ncbi:MAG: VTT domain-containing protein [Planctomycetes bacterium]|nr:VTT domain-containing protein [Planctomycetota bacterium]